MDHVVSKAECFLSLEPQVSLRLKLAVVIKSELFGLLNVFLSLEMKIRIAFSFKTSSESHVKIP
jgi:hypothetical protein